jgi:hypothetical protein
LEPEPEISKPKKAIPARRKSVPLAGEYVKEMLVDLAADQPEGKTQPKKAAEPHAARRPLPTSNELWALSTTGRFRTIRASQLAHLVRPGGRKARCSVLLPNPGADLTPDKFLGWPRRAAGGFKNGYRAV